MHHSGVDTCAGHRCLRSVERGVAGRGIAPLRLSSSSSTYSLFPSNPPIIKLTLHFYFDRHYNCDSLETMCFRKTTSGFQMQPKFRHKSAKRGRRENRTSTSRATPRTSKAADRDLNPGPTATPKRATPKCTTVCLCDCFELSALPNAKN